MESKQTDIRYIGSTIQKPKARLYCHKRNPTKGSGVLTQYANCEIVVIENFPCETKAQLTEREEYWCKKYKKEGISLSNINKCFITDDKRAKYYEDNKEKKAKYYEDNKEKRAKYREDNKEKIAEQQAKYCEDNKEKIAKYYEDNKGQIAEKKAKYYEDNKEKLLEQRAKYCVDNKEKIAEQRAEKLLCEICNCYITRGHMSRHKKTKKHMNFILIR